MNVDAFLITQARAVEVQQCFLFAFPFHMGYDVIKFQEKGIWNSMSRQILLTISLLISGRSDTVRKCLESIRPLLEQIPSELILVDTGCGEAVREIIEEYTDRIVDFNWCRDFSKARNAGLKQAKGQWFLYLDDDEWFEDVSDIIRFFHSGEYRVYGVGLYNQRNYLVSDGSEYTELLVSRMIRLEPDIQFIHRIHECFNRAPGIPKKLDAFVHHYGYIYENAEEHRAHAMRNISLLKEEAAEQPGSMRHVLQLVQEYNSVNDRETSLELSLEGITKAEQGPVEDEYCLPPLYANEIYCYIVLNRYEEAIDRGEMYLEKRCLDKMVSAFIAGLLTAAYLEKKNDAKCLERTEYYWEIYQDYLKNDEEYMEYNMPITNTCFHERRRAVILGNGVRAAIRLGKDKLAWQWFAGIGWEGRRDYADAGMIREIIRHIQTAGKKEQALYREMCDILVSHEEWKDFAVREMMENCMGRETLSERIRAAAPYGEVRADHWFLKLVRLAAGAFLAAEGEAEMETEGAGSLQELRDRGMYFCPQEAEDTAGELWNIMEETMPLMKAFDLLSAVSYFGGSNRQVLEQIPFLRWEKGIAWYFSRFSWKEAEWWTERFQDVLDPGGIRLLAWKAACGISCASGADADIYTILEGLKEYALNRTSLCGRIYREEIIRERKDILSVEDQGAYAVWELLERTEEEDYITAVNAVREISGLLPGLANIMKQYLKWLEERLQKQKEESSRTAGEFQALAGQIKAKIYGMAEAGQYQAALAVSEQLLALMPADKEILQIREKILKMC